MDMAVRALLLGSSAGGSDLAETRSRALPPDLGCDTQQVAATVAVAATAAAAASAAAATAAAAAMEARLPEMGTGPARAVA